MLAARVVGDLHTVELGEAYRPLVTRRNRHQEAAGSRGERRTKIALAIVSNRDVEQQERMSHEIDPIAGGHRQRREAQDLGAVDEAARCKLALVRC